MDNPLTPNKIQRLIHYAEDRSFNLPTVPRRLLVNDDESKRFTTNPATFNKSTANCESSSGILDLERIEAFGESGIGNESLSRSTAFHPGEMTGRSTGADEINSRTMPLGRHSLALDSLTNKMNKQTTEIQDVMRHSIATNYSFHSKRDLTADEASLVMREAILPVQQTTQTYFADTMLTNNSDLSVGAYFKNRCPEFGRMLGKTDSPDRSAVPSITEVSVSVPVEQLGIEMSQICKMDQSLDCVPVRQARHTNIDKVPDKHNINNPNIGKVYEKLSFNSHAKSENNTELLSGKVRDKNYPTGSKAPEMYVPMTLNPVSSSTLASHKSFMHASKPTDVLIRNLQASMRIMTDDTEGSAENSLSISKIADYLGKQSNVSVTDMLQLNNHKKPLNRKPPLTELHMNIRENSRNEEMQVSNLRDTKKAETASSAGTMNTVILLHKLKLNEEKKDVPAVIVTCDSLNKNDEQYIEMEDFKGKQTSIKSKSPSSKSQSTLSTVQENFTSFKSGDSPLHTSKGEVNTSHVLHVSPNIEYKELDKSVDWREVMQQKRLKQEGFAKEQWAEILTTTAYGFVGVSLGVTITVTTLTDSWLTAKFQFDDLPNDGKDLAIELPRLPLLLSPGKSEQFTLHITSNVEMNTTLPFTMILKDASVDGDVEQKGNVEINIKMPMIQAMSCDGVNKVTFPPIQEKGTLIKYFVLISDCPVDLQLDLSVVEGESIFTIKSVQEIKKSDVNKVLMDRQGSTDDPQPGKGKSKGMNKQLCRLSCGNAIRVTIKFNAPKLSELQIAESAVTFNGALNVTLIGINTVLRKVELIGVVGSVHLVVKTAANKLHLTNEPTSITLANTGSIPGIWIVKFKNNPAIESFPFKVAPSKFEIRPGAIKVLNLTYMGSEDSLCEATLVFEDVTSDDITLLEICGGTDKPKSFPIKTNHNNMSWVHVGRKELSLKNSSNKKVHIRCQIVGEGFSIDLPGGESRGIYCLPFAPSECRPLPIIFAPTSNFPHMATLHLVYDKNSDFSRRIRLFGSESGEPMRWSGLVTYGDTALVRAVNRAPIILELYNKSAMPSFICARVHFNLQYMSVASGAALAGARRVVGGRARHALGLRVEWARVERRARDAATAALATVSVLTGAEFTRRRILKILRDESNGELDTSLLEDRLKVLVEQFEGEDLSMDNALADFKETKESLNELIGGLQELTAQIVLPQDFADENTIIISDDTFVEHHTLCD